MSSSKVLLPTIKIPVTIEQLVSAKTNNPYNRITIEFGDYKYSSFMRDEQVQLAQLKLKAAGVIEPADKIDLTQA